MLKSHISRIFQHSNHTWPYFVKTCAPWRKIIFSQSYAFLTLFIVIKKRWSHFSPKVLTLRAWKYFSLVQFIKMKRLVPITASSVDIWAFQSQTHFLLVINDMRINSYKCHQIAGVWAILTFFFAKEPHFTYISA